MATNVKKGSTFKGLFEFTDDEWSVIYPYETIEADVRDKAGVFHDTTLTANTGAKTIAILANTAEWATGPAQMDIRITMANGEVIMIPNDSTIALTVLESVTDGSTY